MGRPLRTSYAEKHPPRQRGNGIDDTSRVESDYGRQPAAGPPLSLHPQVANAATHHRIARPQRHHGADTSPLHGAKADMAPHNARSRPRRSRRAELQMWPESGH